MKIALKSDFRDFYDHRFCGSWETPDFVFERMMCDGLHRRAMFIEMEQAGITTPHHGTVKELITQYQDHWQKTGTEFYCQLQRIVIYTDPLAHAGDGKILLTVEEAENRPDILDCFASAYIPNPSGLGVSMRNLRIGRRQFWLKYSSANDWRSNCGDVKIDLISVEEPTLPKKRSGAIWGSPMVAVDFIFENSVCYGIDVNTSPGLGGTGIENCITPIEIEEEFQRWFVNK